MTTKISALPAATSIASADEYVINQSGTTKKFAGAAFEEGSWTPTLGIGSGGAFSGISLNLTDGWYQRHGDIVRLGARINVTGGTGSVSANDYFVIDDASFPFAQNLSEVSVGILDQSLLTDRVTFTVYSTSISGLIFVADKVTGSPSPNNFIHFNVTYEVL